MCTALTRLKSMEECIKNLLTSSLFYKMACYPNISGYFVVLWISATKAAWPELLHSTNLHSITNT